MSNNRNRQSRAGWSPPFSSFRTNSTSFSRSASIAAARSHRTGNSAPTVGSGWRRTAQAAAIRYHPLVQPPAPGVACHCPLLRDRLREKRLTDGHRHHVSPGSPCHLCWKAQGATLVATGTCLARHVQSTEEDGDSSRRHTPQRSRKHGNTSVRTHRRWQSVDGLDVTAFPGTTADRRSDGVEST